MSTHGSGQKGSGVGAPGRGGSGSGTACGSAATGCAWQVCPRPSSPFPLQMFDNAMIRTKSRRLARTWAGAGARPFAWRLCRRTKRKPAATTIRSPATRWARAMSTGDKGRASQADWRAKRLNAPCYTRRRRHRTSRSLAADFIADLATGIVQISGFVQARLVGTDGIQHDLQEDKPRSVIRVGHTARSMQPNGNEWAGPWSAGKLLADRPLPVIGAAWARRRCIAGLVVRPPVFASSRRTVPRQPDAARIGRAQRQGQQAAAERRHEAPARRRATRHAHPRPGPGIRHQGAEPGLSVTLANG
jgi:hypothetical protein